MVLEEADWRARQDAHQARVDAWIAPHLERARRGESHPVHDFLFTYYSHRPAQLRRWHPGFGVVLRGDAPHRQWVGYRGVAAGVAADTAVLNGPRGPGMRHLLELPRATADRRPLFGCFGMHEWAMVHRLAPEDVRHSSWPLRLAPAQVAEVVEAAPVRCTHYDAFRFFSPSARALNVLPLTRDSMPAHEQGGCLHTNMDLYKVAYKLTPLVPSELVADCFALAREIRELDMRASPYDLSALGYSPVPIETTAGREIYVDAQRTFAERAATLRAKLLTSCGPIIEPREVTTWNSPI